MKNIMFVFAGIICLLTMGCKKEKASTATMTVVMKDSPASYGKVLVQVTGVQVNTSASGWVTLPVQDSVYDLLLLQDSANAVLGTGSFPIGNVTQVRLILGQNDSVVVADISYPLSLSSEDETGLKLNINQTLEANTSYKLVLDFVASQSIVLEGNGSYRLKPVLTATFE